jgi:quinol monooxygenase YgiN
MIVEYIRYAIPEDQAGPFEDAYANAGASLEASPHCERYEVARCAEDPTAYTVRIEWDSAEGHLQGFRGSPKFRSFFAAVRPYVERIEEMRHYEVKTAGPRQDQNEKTQS